MPAATGGWVSLCKSLKEKTWCCQRTINAMIASNHLASHGCNNTNHTCCGNSELAFEQAKAAHVVTFLETPQDREEFRAHCDRFAALSATPKAGPPPPPPKRRVRRGIRKRSRESGHSPRRRKRSPNESLSPPPPAEAVLVLGLQARLQAAVHVRALLLAWSR